MTLIYMNEIICFYMRDFITTYVPTNITFKFHRKYQFCTFLLPEIFMTNSKTVH